MLLAGLGRRFLESTRGRVVALLRRGARTVDELAQALDLTDNAVRTHLATLERDGIVRQDGVRRGAGAGKPAVIYEVHPDAEPLFSRAYPPVLTAVLDVLVSELPPDRAEDILRKVGHQIARASGGAAAGTLEERARAASSLLASLGGEIEVIAEDGQLRLKGYGCPLSATVSRRPELCRAVESLVSDVVGAPVREQCEHGERPRCCFVVA
jgi:predicted ArsR family transcriptional regulator